MESTLTLDFWLDSEFEIFFNKIEILYKDFIFSPYNLTAAVYAEIDSDKYSQVVVLVKDGPKFNTFESLRGAKACFPEYGGIGEI